MLWGTLVLAPTQHISLHEINLWYNSYCRSLKNAFCARYTRLKTLRPRWSIDVSILSQETRLPFVPRVWISKSFDTAQTGGSCRVRSLHYFVLVRRNMSVADAGIQGVRLYATYENAIWFAITISITKIKSEMILNFLQIYCRL